MPWGRSTPIARPIKPQFDGVIQREEEGYAADPRVSIF